MTGDILAATFAVLIGAAAGALILGTLAWWADRS